MADRFSRSHCSRYTAFPWLLVGLGLISSGPAGCRDRGERPSGASPVAAGAVVDAAPLPGMRRSDADPRGPADLPNPRQAQAAPIAQPVPAEIAAKVGLDVVVRKLQRPVLVTFAPGDPAGRIYIVEQVGRVRLFDPAAGGLVEKPVLDLSQGVSRDNEQGLLGLAFHPGFAQNSRLFVHYTDKTGDSRVVEYQASAAGDTVDPKSARELLHVPQPYSNHNGGHVLVGPDGWLWIGLGDGGAANDPHENGQKDGTLLGKMVRLDPDAKTPAPIEHMKGLRNPWRYAFDPKRGDLYIADVGQSLWEEVNVVAAADALRGGQNFGWNVMEGFHCFRRKDCSDVGLVLPVTEYAHEDGTGCSITGGEVYRGAALPELDGAYFYADFCTGLVRSFRFDAASLTATDHWDWRRFGLKLSQLSSFGRDSAGELYLASLDGTIYRVVRR